MRDVAAIRVLKRSHGLLSELLVSPFVHWLVPALQQRSPQLLRKTPRWPFHQLCSCPAGVSVPCLQRWCARGKQRSQEGTGKGAREISVHRSLPGHLWLQTETGTRLQLHMVPYSWHGLSVHGRMLPQPQSSQTEEQWTRLRLCTATHAHGSSQRGTRSAADQPEHNVSGAYAVRFNELGWADREFPTIPVAWWPPVVTEKRQLALALAALGGSLVPDLAVSTAASPCPPAAYGSACMP